MALDPNTFLSSLLDTGPDAALNLFGVRITLKEYDSSRLVFEKKYLCRIVQAPNLVVRDSSTVSIPYQNISVDRISSGTSITKTQSLEIRVDDNFEVLKALRQYQCIDENGSFYQDPDKCVDEVVIEAYKNSREKTEFEVAYAWHFYNCYITNVTPLSYSYDSASPATANVTFVWSTYKEG